MTRSELLARIHVLLGGRVAEEMIFSDVSTGGQNDLQKATEIARTMVTQFGMSEKVGLVALEGRRTPMFLPIPTQVPKEYSEETAHLVDTEVKKILSETHEKVTAILVAHRQALEDLAKVLLEKEIIERPQLQAILRARSLEHAAEGRVVDGFRSGANDILVNHSAEKELMMMEQHSTDESGPALRETKAAHRFLLARWRSYRCATPSCSLTPSCPSRSAVPQVFKQSKTRCDTNSQLASSYRKTPR